MVPRGGTSEQGAEGLCRGTRFDSEMLHCLKDKHVSVFCLDLRIGCQQNSMPKSIGVLTLPFLREYTMDKLPPSTQRGTRYHSQAKSVDDLHPPEAPDVAVPSETGQSPDSAADDSMA